MKVGDIVYVGSSIIRRAHRKYKGPVATPIRKVGTKYIYVNIRGRDVRFNKDTLEWDGKSYPWYVIFLSEEDGNDSLREQRTHDLKFDIGRFFLGSCDVSLEDLEAIAKIIGINKEIDK